MELVDELVLTPFKEIVEKGKRAVENAADGEAEMLKASKALVREGERALKKIEPLCKKHFVEYGSNFLDALKENGKVLFRRDRLHSGGATRGDEMKWWETQGQTSKDISRVNCLF
jgi:hypothetical protein